MLIETITSGIFFIFGLVVVSRFWANPSVRTHPENGVYRVRQTNDVSFIHCSGCFVVFSFGGLTLGFALAANFIIYFFGVILILSIYSMLKDAVQSLRVSRIEGKNLARIEINDDTILHFDRDGSLIQEVQISDIVSLEMYQGLDATKKRFDVQVLKLLEDREFEFPENIEYRKLLLKRVEEATNKAFQYRNNSTRSKVRP